MYQDPEKVPTKSSPDERVSSRRKFSRTELYMFEISSSLSHFRQMKLI